MASFGDQPASVIGDIFRAFQSACEDAGITEADLDQINDPHHPIWAEVFKRVGLSLPAALNHGKGTP